jgi:hypothetical protein
MILKNKKTAEKLINIFKTAAKELLNKYNTDTIEYSMFLNHYNSIYDERVPSMEINGKQVSMWVDPADYYDEYSRLTEESNNLIEGSYTKSVSLYIKTGETTKNRMISCSFAQVKFIHVKSMSHDGLGETHKVFVELPDTQSGFVIDESYEGLAKEIAILINQCCDHWVNLFDAVIESHI